jgi:hypothetical protein
MEPDRARQIMTDENTCPLVYNIIFPVGRFAPNNKSPTDPLKRTLSKYLFAKPNRIAEWKRAEEGPGLRVILTEAKFLVPDLRI